ncbi:ABC transporter ATP-binding protein [soil metagenome]
MRLAIEELSYQIGDARVLAGVDFEAADGAVVALVGPNGSGKSTLLRLLYRSLDRQAGRVWLDGGDLWALSNRSAARLLGAVPQEQPSEFELTVEELVRLGRLPHQRMLLGDGADDRRLVSDAMAATGVAHLAHRRLDQLSGGERQRAVVARALAQQPSVLLLDEPTTHLDIGYQHELLALVRRLGLTTVVALHDLNLAASYCDHVVVLADGGVVAGGPVDEVLVPEVIEAAFGIAACRVVHPATGRPQLLFHPTRRPPEPGGAVVAPTAGAPPSSIEVS